MIQDTKLSEPKFDKRNALSITNALSIFRGAPLLAGLALSLAGGLLAVPAAHAGGTTVVIVHYAAPIALPSHVTWGSIRRQSSGVTPAAAPSRTPVMSGMKPSATQSGEAAPAPLHIAWIQVRLYQDGSYEAQPAGYGMDGDDDDADDAATVEFVPILVGE